VRADDIREARGVEDLGHRIANVFVHRKHAGVDERGTLIFDQELVELELRLRLQSTDPIDPIGDLIDPCHQRLLLPLSYVTHAPLRRYNTPIPLTSGDRNPSREDLFEGAG
jgi:hypothetical protein